MKTYRRVEVHLYAFLDSLLDRGESSVSRPPALPQGKEPPGSHWTGSGMDTRVCLVARAKKKLRHAGYRTRSASP